MAQRLAETLGQSVVIENKPGATGMIGAASVAKSPADGYTVLFGAASEMAINASLFRNMTYDPRTDFEPVMLVATFPLVFVSAASSSRSLKDLIEVARAKPDAVSYGSIGSGSPQHLAAELLSSMAKAKRRCTSNTRRPRVCPTPEAGRVVDLCADSELGYLKNRTRFAPGETLLLDEAYRLAHLPLIAPDHPDVLRSRPDTAYRMGRHDRIFSLVLPVPPDALE
ncbi:hypothetical protein OSTOST_14519, partial [Ostertagia ostertagi]